MVPMPQSSAITRLTLLPTAPRDRGAAKVRRYRLAAVRPQPPQDPAGRFTHLKRTHD
jgi:hypothetical protein